MRSTRRIVTCFNTLLACVSCGPHYGHRTEPPAPLPSASVADRVIRDMCDERVVLLGESPTHGFGNTLRLKVELTRRLVDECHYDTFLIESGAYDFLNIRKALHARRPVTDSMVAAAIGGLWSNEDVAPLIPFLLDRARNGQLVLGGLDDQLGRGTWAQLQMPADLVEYLRGADKARCLAVLRRHMLWQYADSTPYSVRDRDHIVDCLDAIDQNINQQRDEVARGSDSVMIADLRRMLARDFPEAPLSGLDAGTQSFNDRDRSMYMNFRWWTSRASKHDKVIVWTATVHAARSLSGVPGRDRSVPLGSYIAHDFDGRAFALGFSAASGSYAMGRQPARALSPAPDSSLERYALRGSDSEVGYLDRKRLHTLGMIPARLVGADFTTARWGDVLDGLIVFREERPPRRSAR